MVAEMLAARHRGGGTLVDVGCGRGDLKAYIERNVTEYIGADIVRYDGFPSSSQFVQADFDRGTIALESSMAEIVVAVETIEHVENPRAFVRELVRLAKPSGLVLLTTPNQLSLLSLATLITKGQFNAFQEAPGLYPAHITALLEIDLRRIAAECALAEIEIRYSDVGRVPFSSRRWPSSAIFSGRRFSDNVLVCGRRPHDLDAFPTAPRPNVSPA